MVVVGTVVINVGANAMINHSLTNAQYVRLHRWARKYLPMPESCNICNAIKPLEVSNVSGMYVCDIGDWQWICRHCHMKYDYHNNMRNHFVIPKDRKCGICGSGDTMLRDSKYPKWYLDESGQTLCHSCYYKRPEMREKRRQHYYENRASILQKQKMRHHECHIKKNKKRKK